jgi:Cupredoxin-like domain
MDTRKMVIVGIVLIAVGAAGLIAVGGRVGAYDDESWSRRGPMMRGPMMRGPMGRGPGTDGYGPFGMGGGGRPGFRAGVLPPVAGARTIEVEATDSGIKPDQITLKEDETVNIALVNRGTSARVLMIPGFGVRLSAAPGQTTTTGFEADRSGEYPFFAGVPGRRDGFSSGLIVVTE